MRYTTVMGSENPVLWRQQFSSDWPIDLMQIQMIILAGFKNKLIGWF